MKTEDLIELEEESINGAEDYESFKVFLKNSLLDFGEHLFFLPAAEISKEKSFTISADGEIKQNSGFFVSSAEPVTRKYYKIDDYDNIERINDEY